jgi:phosphatidate cytidylyltransferase
MGTLLAKVLPWVALALAAGAAGMALSNRRLDPVQARRRWIKFAVYVLVIALELTAAASGVLVLVAGLVLLQGTREIRAALLGAPGSGFPAWWLGLLALSWLLLGLGLLAFCLLLTPSVQLLVVLQVLVFDGFSQVCGQLLGRHAMVPRISPAKTWEGLAGGVAACLLVSWIVPGLPGSHSGAALLAGALSAALALAGDLMASALKRRCGIKDFGTLIPGHGGVLDRFDSLVSAAAGWALLAAVGAGPAWAGG